VGPGCGKHQGIFSVLPLRRIKWSQPFNQPNEGHFMRIGNYESSEQSSSQAGTAVTFLLIGMGIGALTALLLAPKTGKQLRKDIRRKYEDVKETVDDWTDDAREAAEDLIDRGSEIADEIRERVTPLTKAMKK
jgi:gas vesicle protein